MAFNLNRIPLIQRSTPEQRLARLKICQDCEHRLFNGGLMVCKQCGCAMKFKTWLKLADCPLHKWPDIGQREKANEPEINYDEAFK